MFTDMVHDPEQQYNAGWYWICTVFIMIVVTIVRVVLNACYSLRTYAITGYNYYTREEKKEDEIVDKTDEESESSFDEIEEPPEEEKQSSDSDSSEEEAEEIIIQD